MKTRIFLFFAIIIAVFSSCNLDGSSNYTPEFYFSPLVNQHGDTLKAYLTDDGSYRLDTLQVGDTVSIFLVATGYENNLKSFYIKQSSDSVSKIILPPVTSMDSIFTPESNYKTGKFILEGKMPTLYFSLRYLAVKPSREAKLTFTIQSDAVFENSLGSNTSIISFKTPIVAKRP